MTEAHLPFKNAVEARDLEALAACLTAGVVFHSPITYRPFEGRDAVMMVLTAVMEVFEHFRYGDVIAGEGAAALFFDARVGGREVQGVDHLTFGPEGLVEGLTVMLRPRSGLIAVSEEMERRLGGHP